ncbi:hypothetical protein [Lebetimonas sp. JS138]|uniref:hypothetical protein n=1 Tax=Lebetimonas sp. JS138 TaxID=990072 RepID=UPI0004633451|nr:hypothetical protein [Lebetimonas sp. JS138]
MTEADRLSTGQTDLYHLRYESIGRTGAFVKKAGTVIAATMVMVYNVQEDEDSDEKTTFMEDLKEQFTGFFGAVKDSISAMFGSIMTEMFELIKGKGWKIQK